MVSAALALPRATDDPHGLLMHSIAIAAASLVGQLGASNALAPSLSPRHPLSIEGARAHSTSLSLRPALATAPRARAEWKRALDRHERARRGLCTAHRLTAAAAAATS